MDSLINFSLKALINLICIDLGESNSQSHENQENQNSYPYPESSNEQSEEEKSDEENIANMENSHHIDIQNSTMTALRDIALNFN